MFNDMILTNYDYKYQESREKYPLKVSEIMGKTGCIADFILKEEGSRTAAEARRCQVWDMEPET